jgi:hypothetical protein
VRALFAAACISNLVPWRAILSSSSSRWVFMSGLKIILPISILTILTVCHRAHEESQRPTPTVMMPSAPSMTDASRTGDAGSTPDDSGFETDASEPTDAGVMDAQETRDFGVSDQGFADADNLDAGFNEDAGSADAMSTDASLPDSGPWPPIDEVVAGANHSCVRAAGRVRCWGAGGAGQLGYGNTDNIGDDESPASAGDVYLGTDVRAIAAGG